MTDFVDQPKPVPQPEAVVPVEEQLLLDQTAEGEEEIRPPAAVVTDSSPADVLDENRNPVCEPEEMMREEAGAPTEEAAAEVEEKEPVTGNMPAEELVTEDVPAEETATGAVAPPQYQGSKPEIKTLNDEATHLSRVGEAAEAKTKKILDRVQRVQRISSSEIPLETMAKTTVPLWTEPGYQGVPTKEESTEEHETTTASGWTQVRALMEKNALTKLRTPGASMAELFSPVLLMLVLWFAYKMSDPVFFTGEFFHSMHIDLPLFWDSEIYGFEEFQTYDVSESHRRTLKQVEGEGLQAVDYGLEAGEEEAKKWNWAHLMKSAGMDGMETGEDMGMINDLLTMNHVRKLFTFEMNFDDVDELEEEGEGVEEDVDIAEEPSVSEEVLDSANWMEEVWTDIKAETIGKVDWDEVVEEIKDNFGDLWEEAKGYIFIQSGRSAYRTLNLIRLRLKDVLKRPIVVPTFGQYVWASRMLSSFINVKHTLPRVMVDSNYGRQWGNLLTLGTIHLTPSDHPMTQKFLTYLETTYPLATSQVVIRTHQDHETALEFVMQHLDDERTWALIDLGELADGSDEQVKGGSFMIRLNYTTVPNTAMVENYVALGLSTKFQRYFLSGYLTLQRTINDFIMELDGCNPNVDPFYSMPMPVADFEQNTFFLNVGYLLGLVLVMAFLYPTSRLIQSLVEERETRMKETLLILGVRPWAHTTSWVLTTVISFLFISMLMSLALRHILLHQPLMIIWVWMGTFSMAAMSFCFFLASFFSKSKLAAVIGPMALFASLLPRFVFFGTNRYEAIGGKYLASILPGTALAFSADIVGDYEYGEQSVRDNVWVGSYSFGSSICFFLFDTIFYMVLAWYTEQVIPREFGAAPRPWYFPFVWCVPKYLLAHFSSSKKLDVSDDDSSVASLKKNAEEACVELVNDPALVPRVVIDDLVKVYNKKQVKPSVNHLNLTLYESQITALLGHNGAGKTTTVSVLTGLYPPTSGDVTVYGNSIVKDLAKARQSIGICPQHNVLFGSLTVMEHLEFFSKIKGVSINQQDLKDRAFELGLTEDQLRTTAAALSGGNKRKLSVAIALCGNPKFLILDEPTSAMDPTARRRTWQVLRKKRAGRVTLLTTHFMDEAEHLSDRVAVVKQGELQCCGSPLFLKDKYNLGWNMTVVMEKPEASEDPEDEYSGCQLRIASFLQQYVAGATLVRRSGRELTFCLPKGSEDLFPECFDAFELQSKDLGVSSYGIENASFEEVFLLLAEKEARGDGEDTKDDSVSLAETGSVETDNLSRASLSDNGSVASSKRSAGSGKTDGSAESDELVVAVQPKVDTLKLKDWEQYKGMSAFRQIGLLYWKRWTVQKRDAKGAFFAIVLPVGLIALVICVLTTNLVVAGPAIEMSPALYKSAYSTSNEFTTQVLVGGGNSAPDDTAVHTEYLFMESGLAFEYPNADVKRLEKTSTTDLSRYLMETYNDHDHPTRFGAFSIEDNVEVSFNVNFTSFRDQINYYKTKAESHGTIKLRDQKVDVLEILGIAGKNGRFYWKKSVADLEAEFYSWSNMDPNMRIRTVDLHNLTQRMLSSVMASSDRDWAEIRTQYVQKFANFTDDLYEQVMTYLRSQRVHDLEANATKIYDDFMVEAEKIMDNSDQMSKDLELMVKEFVEVGFYRQEDDQANGAVFKWGGNLEGVMRKFVKDLKTLGEDQQTDTLSIYGLAKKLAKDVKTLVNYNLNEITGYNLNEITRDNLDEIVGYNHSYTVDSIEEAIIDAFKAQDNEFDREVVIREMGKLMSGVGELYGYQSFDPSDSIKDATKWVDERLQEYSDGSITRVPGTMFVAPIIVFDYLLGKWDLETVSPDEAFGYLSEILGGNSRKKDGFISFRAKDIIVDMAKLEIDIKNVIVTTAHGTLIEVDDDFSLRFALDGLKDLVTSNTTYLQFLFDVPAKTSLLHNSSSPHAVAVFNQAYMEHRYKQCLGDVRSGARLVSVNHPLPLTAKQSLEIKVMLSVLAGLFILIPFCYIPATFIVFLVRERVSKSKHLQLVSGVNMSAYWIATYLWDLTLYFILSVLVMLVFLMYGSAAQVFIGSWDSFFCTFCLVFGYGASALPFSYLLSRTFSNSSTAQISIAGIGWLTGFVTVISYVTMINIEKTQHIAEGLQPWFRLFPAYNVGEGFMFMSTTFWEREILGIERYPFDWEVSGRSICYLFLLSLPYSFLVLVFEYADDGGAGGFIGRGLRAISYQWTKIMLKWHGIEMSNGVEDADYASLNKDQLNEDEDVVRERQFVQKNMEELRQNAPVVLINLWKIYPPSVGIIGTTMTKVRRFFTKLFFSKQNSIVAVGDEQEEEKTFVPKQAVRGVYTMINKGETYALLGANGAGKTTTMGMLTGDVTSTNGSAYIAGHNATGGTNDGVSEARKNIGFCPQKDPLLDLMTGRETLTMFARLRGVPPNQVDKVVEELLERLTLTPHADKVTKAYSGGNKRKLSLGLALIGDPKVLLIDESSSGLDPLAKRKMWDLIEEAARHRSVILTTHSMQEAEALCTRVAIMVKGQFVCLGSVQHLKTKYLDGYSVDMFCKGIASEADVDRVVTQVLQALPNCIVSERHGRFMRFEVKNVSSLGLGTCFRRLQELKNDPNLHVENYSVSQSSLEQVFVKLVNSDGNNQRDNDTEPGVDCHDAEENGIDC